MACRWTLASVLGWQDLELVAGLWVHQLLHAFDQPAQHHRKVQQDQLVQPAGQAQPMKIGVKKANLATLPEPANKT
jgi:hypothetical protein